MNVTVEVRLPSLKLSSAITTVAVGVRVSTGTESGAGEMPALPARSLNAVRVTVALAVLSSVAVKMAVAESPSSAKTIEVGSMVPPVAATTRES
nr:hypothetical protein [Methylobacterium sp. Leaf106]